MNIVGELNFAQQVTYERERRTLLRSNMHPGTIQQVAARFESELDANARWHNGERRSCSILSAGAWVEMHGWGKAGVLVQEWGKVTA